MDTYRAKKYLIISLLILNILLIISIHKDRLSFSNNMTKNSLKNVYKIMEQNNITTSYPISYKEGTAFILTGSYITPSDENMPNLYKNNYTMNPVHYKWLEIRDKKTLKAFDKENVLNYTKTFLNDNFPSKKYLLRECYNEDDVFSIIYEEKYDDFAIENSYVQFIIHSDFNSDIAVISMDIDNQKKHKTLIISEVEAIISVLGNLRGKTIIKISKIYKSLDNEADLMNAVSTTLLPFYRIELGDEEIIYVNAVKN